MRFVYLIFFSVLAAACSKSNSQPKDMVLSAFDITNKKNQVIEIPYMEKRTMQIDTLTGDSIYNNGWSIVEGNDRKSNRKFKLILGGAYFNDSDGNRWHLGFYVNNGDGVYGTIIVLLNNESTGLKIPEYNFHFKGTYMDILAYESEIFRIINFDPRKNQSQFSLSVSVKK